MTIDLADYDEKTREAVRLFWGARDSSAQKQLDIGKVDAGQRGSVTGGKTMDGFLAIMVDVVQANGLPNADIHLQQRLLTLPGFFRPTKLWDMLIMNGSHLVAALELKSQVGPSFGNNFNNRCEESIGTAYDFATAYREGAFGESLNPFTGWLILVEDDPRSRSPVANKAPHFPVRDEFKNTSYAMRYDQLCQKLVREKLYSAAAVIMSPREAVTTGDYVEMSNITGLRAFFSGLAAHAAAESARSENK